MPPAQDLTHVLLDGRYRLVRLMGEGGMGQVYEGKHETLDRKVAIKVLLPRYAYEPKFRERFLREAKAASKVRHPNVVQILDFGDTPGGSVYFAMELLEGRDLAALLRSEGPLPWPRARGILLQAVGALAAAHERKIIHRDIKPANFFIEEEGTRDHVKVLDFGIAKLAVDAGNEESSLAQSLTGTGEVFGTAKYMAPEQAYGASNDPRVDVYSLGIVAYELLTGQVPFTGVSAFHIITRHVNERPKPPRELVPAILPAVEAWILRALAKQPDERFASMAEMEQALLAIGVEPPRRTLVAAPRPQPVPMPPMPPAPAAVPPAAQAPSMPAVPVAAPAVVQARPRSVSDSITAPTQARSVEAPAPRGPATSVIPTRLKPPSPVTSGELMTTGKNPSSSTSGASTSTPTGDSESSGIGAATSRLQSVGEASGTGPQYPYGAGGGVPETDPHPRYTGSQPTVSWRTPSLLLGLLGTVGGGLAVLVGYLAIASGDDETHTPAPVVEPAKAAADVAVVAPSPPPEAGVPGDATATSAPVEPLPSERKVPTELVEPEPTPPQPVPSEPEPKPEPKASSKPASKPAKPAAPLTDAKVQAQLVRTLAKKCAALGAGTKTNVSVMVAAKGNVIGTLLKGTPELKKCIVAQTEKTRFPAGETRTVRFDVSF